MSDLLLNPIDLSVPVIVHHSGIGTSPQADAFFWRYTLDMNHRQRLALTFQTMPASYVITHQKRDVMLEIAHHVYHASSVMRLAERVGHPLLDIRPLKNIRLNTCMMIERYRFCAEQ
jgi:hypothetical protein